MHPAESLDCYDAGYPLIGSSSLLPLTGLVLGLLLGISYTHPFTFNFLGKGNMRGRLARGKKDS